MQVLLIISSLCYICAFLHVFCIILPYFGNLQMVQGLEKLIYWKMFELPFPSYLLEESITDIGYAYIGKVN